MKNENPRRGNGTGLIRRSGERERPNNNIGSENLPPSIAVQRTCANCRFFFGYADRSNRGECRHRSPRLVDPFHPEAIWPLSANFQWCGEWERSDG
ncbi:MAG: hypothetical protein ACTHNA_11735 [Sphingopyxis terrae]|uniref:hypothetical protein n=1 Tax=Sphingopyxis terrae TaxID=33052 RepID=UPI003F7D0637